MLLHPKIPTIRTTLRTPRGNYNLEEALKSHSFRNSNLTSNLEIAAMSGFANKRITEEDLVSSNFDASKLREKGFDEHQLKLAGFDAADLKAAGFNAVQLRCAGFTPADLKRGGFSVVDVSEAGFNNSRLVEAGFTAHELKDKLNLNLMDLKNAGFGATELKGVGFVAAQLKSVGFTAKDIRHLYSPGEILRAGYSKAEMKPLGLWPHDGEWQSYNQYWNCCFSLDKKSLHCSAHI